MQAAVADIAPRFNVARSLNKDRFEIAATRYISIVLFAIAATRSFDEPMLVLE